MKKQILVLVLSATAAFWGCRSSNPNDNVDEGTVKEATYNSPEMGWTVTIPEGWTVTEKDVTAARNEKGLKAAEEALGDVDMSSLKNLIAFQKDKFNIFQSSSESFSPEKDGSWTDNNQLVKNLLYNTYIEKGIKVDTTATTLETIDGREFETYGYTIYGPDGKFLLTQKLYSRWMDGFSFGASLNYNNNKDGDVLLRTFRDSKFTK